MSGGVQIGSWQVADKMETRPAVAASRAKAKAASSKSVWWNPANWLYALGGHVTRGAEVSLLTYASSGRLFGSRHVASGVELVAGRLVASE